MLCSCFLCFCFLSIKHSFCVPVHHWDSCSNLSVPSCFHLFGRFSLNCYQIGLLQPPVLFPPPVGGVFWCTCSHCFAPFLPSAHTVHTHLDAQPYTQTRCMFKHMLYNPALSIYEYGSVPKPFQSFCFAAILPHLNKWQIYVKRCPAHFSFLRCIQILRLYFLELFSEALH